MKIRTRSVLVALLACSLGAAVAAGPPVSHDRALDIAERTLGLDDPVILGAAATVFPVSGVSCETFKVVGAGGAVHTIVLDPNGNVLDDASVADAEVAAREARDGNIDASVWAHLDTLHDHEQVRVAIWLNVPVTAARMTDLEHDDPEVTIAGVVPIDEDRDAMLRSRSDSVKTRLAQLGVEPRYREGSQIVYATMRASHIPQLLGETSIDRIYLDPVHETQVGVARRTVRAHRAENRGFDGSGIKVAVIEVGGKYKRANPYLEDIVQDENDISLSEHTTEVVGILRSTNSEHTGVAPGCVLRVGGSSEGFESELQDRTEAAVDWGARVVNLSLGRENSGNVGSNDRFYDGISFADRVTVVAAAGNEGNDTGYVLTPATGYNVIAVGNFDDFGTQSWGDDSLNSSSSWRDPVSNNSDREKPDLSAPGTLIHSTSNSAPWTHVAGSGTSFSTPIVSGVVAQLMQRVPSLKTRPEAVRAILMATARNNIEGAADLSEFDGAGGIDGWQADRISRGKGGGWASRDYICAERPEDWQIKKAELQANKKVRVVIVWGNDPGYSLYGDRPGADLDLEIRAPGGAVVTGSYSFDNTFEIVEFTPAQTGMYKFRVVRARCSEDPIFVAVAWYQQ